MSSSAARRIATAAGAVVLFASVAGIASAMHFSSWGSPTNAEAVPGASSELNTPFNDGCPIQSPDGLSLYMASNRPGGLGGQDIWVAHRDTAVLTLVILVAIAMALLILRAATRRKAGRTQVALPAVPAPQPAVTGGAG